jgi:hypothetical protein
MRYQLVLSTHNNQQRVIFCLLNVNLHKSVNLHIWDLLFLLLILIQYAVITYAVIVMHV